MNEVKIKIGKLEMAVDEAKELYQQLKTVFGDEQQVLPVYQYQPVVEPFRPWPSWGEWNPWSQSAIGSIES